MMKNKSTIAVCGLMDSGKSTLIKSMLHLNTGRTVEPDALCIEQATGRTITGTRIACPVNDRTDLVFCDCPGHMEYLPEIVSGLCASAGYILIMDDSRKEASITYAKKLHEVAAALAVPCIAVVHSHATSTDAEEGVIAYDAGAAGFDDTMRMVLACIERELDERNDTSDRSSVVWFDSFEGDRARYTLHSARRDGTDRRTSEWEYEGSHESGDVEDVLLPAGVHGRFIVCTHNHGRIVGVGFAV